MRRYELPTVAGQVIVTATGTTSAKFTAQLAVLGDVGKVAAVPN